MINPIWLYPITFLLLILMQKDKKKHPIYMIILFMYLLSSASSVYLTYTESYFKSIDVTLFPVIYHIVVTFWLLAPFSKIDNKKISQIRPIHNIDVFRIFTYFIIFLCFTSIIDSYQHIDLYAMLYESSSLREDFGATGSITLFNYLKYFGRMAYEVALVLSFYYIVYYPQKKLLIILLLISSLAAVIDGMTVAGREYVIKYSFLFVIMFLLCKGKFSKSWNRTLITIGSVLFSFGIFVFVMISISKFGMRQAGFFDQDTTTESFFSYYGMGFVNFSAYFKQFAFTPSQIPVGSIHFPFFAGSSTSVFQLGDRIRTQIQLNTFATSPGGLLTEGGFFFVTFIVLLWGLLLRFVMTSKLTVYKLYFIILFSDYAFSYIFFFNDVYNGARVFFLLLIVLLDYLEAQTTRNIDGLRRI